MIKKSFLIRSIIIFLILISVIFLVWVVFNNKNKNNNKEVENEIKEEKEKPIPELPKLKIIDLASKTRPISIMIDNETGSWPQAGIQDALIVYEILVEGGETRLLAIFKDKETAMIGPIRSTRHYFLDYGLENDTIFGHFGFSPKAIEDIGKLKINNISGTQADGVCFWREKPLGGWHNVFTSISKLKERAIVKGYRMTTEEPNLFAYSVNDIYFEKDENVKDATKVKVVYSYVHNASYEYDEASKTYKKFSRGKPHVDRVTGAQYTFKNIIVYKVKTYNLNDGSGKGRIGIENIGSGDGYYITNGKTIPIKWEKKDRQSKTVYKDLSGKLIILNDGNTIIHIQPSGLPLTIE